MPGKFSNLQMLVALTVITLVALFIAAKFVHGDADGTATGNAGDAMKYSGNGGGSFSADCQAATGDAAGKCASDNVAALADQVGHEKIGINFTWTLIMGSFVLFMQAGFALLTTG